MENKTVNYFGLVADVIDEFTLVINKGSKDKVNVGDRYMVYGLGKEIIDPETGVQLGTLEIVRGTGRITHVQEKMATLKADTIEKPTKRLRTIKRDSPFSSYLGKETETIEETDGDQEFVPFYAPCRGDRVKPI